MIRKSGYRFSDKIMPNEKERLTAYRGLQSKKASVTGGLFFVRRLRPWRP